MSGMVVVDSRSDTRHDGITLAIDGLVSIQLSAKSAGLLESIVSSSKVSFSYVHLIVSIQGAGGFCFINGNIYVLIVLLFSYLLYIFLQAQLMINVIIISAHPFGQSFYCDCKVWKVTSRADRDSL